MWCLRNVIRAQCNLSPSHIYLHRHISKLHTLYTLHQHAHCILMYKSYKMRYLRLQQHSVICKDRHPLDMQAVIYTGTKEWNRATVDRSNVFKQSPHFLNWQSVPYTFPLTFNHKPIKKHLDSYGQNNTSLTPLARQLHKLVFLIQNF